VVAIRAEDSALRAGPPLLIPLAVDGTAAAIGTAAEATDSMASLPSHPYVHSQLRGAQELPSAQRDRSEQWRATERIRGDLTSPWAAVAGMGKAIGVAAARTGRVTADAVTRASTSIASVTIFNSPKEEP
jgi:hypothetical protein